MAGKKDKSNETPENGKSKKGGDPELGARIKAARVALGDDDFGFCVRVRDVTEYPLKPTQLSSYENGRSYPKLPALKAICEVTGESMDSLVLGR